MAVRYADCTRRQHRNREASETRFAQTADASLSDFGTSDVSPSNGISLQRPLHKQLQLQLQLQLSLRGAKCDCNGRCAGTQGELFLHNEKRAPKRRIHL